MQNLLIESLERVDAVDTKFKRYLYEKINWENRLLAIKGARGVGKTTLILQHIKESLPLNHKVLYVAVDHPYFYDSTILQLADEFTKLGGEFLFLDEIHKYPDWSRELKLIYDKYSNLKVAFTSSSILEIDKGESDLSRRLVSYNLNELSLREFVELGMGVKIPAIGLQQMLKEHSNIALEIKNKITPLLEFNNYQQYGAYPFFIEGKLEYPQKLLAALNQVIENDLTTLYKLDYGLVLKLKKLMFAISSSTPFKPNITKLSERVTVTRPTLLRFLSYLEKAEVIYQLRQSNTGISVMTKPEKLYMHNSNLIHLLSPMAVSTGTLRETFFLNQVSVNHQLTYSKQADFMVDNNYTFEIGGKNKGQKQINGIENAFIVKDNIETGILNVIPLWLFGFLY